MAHTANMKATYENMKLFFEKLNYHAFSLKICGDLKDYEQISADN